MNMPLESLLDVPRTREDFARQAHTAHDYLHKQGAEPYPPEVFSAVKDETILYVMEPSIRHQLATGAKHKKINTQPSYILSGSFDDLKTDNWRELVLLRSQHFTEGLVPNDARLPYAWVRFTGAQAPLIHTPDGLVANHTALHEVTHKKMRLSLENIYQFDPSLFVPDYDLSFCKNRSSY